MKKVIVSDIDGTVLFDGRQEFVKSEKEAFKKVLTTNNVLICASGRTYSNLRFLFDNNDEVIYIAENGSLVVYKDEILSKSLFFDDDALKIIKFLYEYQDKINILVNLPSNAYYLKNKTVYKDFNRTTKVKDIDTFEKFLSFFKCEEVIKISIQRDDMDEFFFNLYDELKEKFKKIQVFNANNTWIDLSPLNTNKGTALKFVLDYFKLNDLPLYVFGDGENDIAMLTMSENSFSPNRALVKVKAMTKHHYDDFSSTLSSLFE